MKYLFIAQLYWPIWLFFREAGHTWLGMFIGGVVVIALFRLLWVLEFPKKPDPKESL